MSETFSIPEPTFPDREPLSTGTIEGKIKIQWATYESRGAVNGYAYIPPETPVDLHKIEVHGDFTYGYPDSYYSDEPAMASGWVGFDTLHCFDIWPGTNTWGLNNKYDIHWTPEMVELEAQTLAARIAIQIRENHTLDG